MLQRCRVHHADAGAAPGAQIAAGRRKRDEVSHVARWRPWRTAGEAVALVQFAGLFPGPAAVQKFRQISAQDQHRPPAGNAWQSAFQPAAHRALRDTEHARRVVDRVAAVALDASPIRTVTGHIKAPRV